MSVPRRAYPAMNCSIVGFLAPPVGRDGVVVLCCLLHPLVADLVDHRHGEAELLHAQQVPEPVGLGEDGQFDLLDDAAHVAQVSGGLVQGSAHLGGGGGDAEVADESDAQGPLRPCGSACAGDEDRVPGAEVVERPHRESDVGHGAGERALDEHGLHGQRCVDLVGVVGLGHPSDGGPQTDDAAGIGGVAHRPADVVAPGDRHHARGDGRTRPAAGATRGPGGVPRVERAPVQVVVGEPAVGERRGVAPTHQHGAGTAQAGDVRAVLVRHGVLERGDALRGGVAGLVRVHLDRHRHAVEGPELLAGGAPAVRLVGHRQRLVGSHLHQGVESRVDRVDPREAALHHLAAGDEPRGHGVCEVGRGPTPELIGGAAAARRGR